MKTLLFAFVLMVIFSSAGIVAYADQEKTLADSIIGPRYVTATPLKKGTLFVSPDGKGSGAIASDPCRFEDLDLYKNRLKIKAGDVVFFRGGVYKFSMNGARRVYLKGGEKGNPVIYESYPGELAIFDGSALKTAKTKDQQWREGRLQLRGQYTILRKIEIRNMPEYGVRIFGKYNKVEGCKIHDNHLSGVGIANLVDGYSVKDTGGSYNVICDNVIYNNSDVGLTHSNYGDGDNADGITIHSGVGNVIAHNTIYGNSDDGIDTWKSMNSMVEYNLVYQQGKGPRGNGNGIKLGGSGKESPLGANAIARHNISYANQRAGFNINAGKNVVMEYNTAYQNKDYGYTLMNDTVLRSNISLENKLGHTGWSKGKTQANNSWQKAGLVKMISTDPASKNFMKPLSQGGFDSIGAYATRRKKISKQKRNI